MIGAKAHEIFDLQKQLQKAILKFNVIIHQAKSQIVEFWQIRYKNETKNLNQKLMNELKPIYI